MYTGWLLVTVTLHLFFCVDFVCQTEMRFYVPNSNADDDEDDGSRKTVEVLHAEIMKHVVIEATGAQVRLTWKLKLPIRTKLKTLKHKHCTSANSWTG
jgi:hypothetical protein